jgi:hypothetical protein
MKKTQHRYDPDVKKGFVKLALGARSAGQPWAEALRAAKDGGYKGSVGGLKKMLKWDRDDNEPKIKFGKAKTTRHGPVTTMEIKASIPKNHKLAKVWAKPSPRKLWEMKMAQLDAARAKAEAEREAEREAEYKVREEAAVKADAEAAARVEADKLRVPPTDAEIAEFKKADAARAWVASENIELCALKALSSPAADLVNHVLCLNVHFGISVDMTDPLAPVFRKGAYSLAVSRFTLLYDGLHAVVNMLSGAGYTPTYNVNVTKQAFAHLRPEEIICADAGRWTARYTGGK